LPFKALTSYTESKVALEGSSSSSVGEEGLSDTLSSSSCRPESTGERKRKNKSKDSDNFGDRPTMKQVQRVLEAADTCFPVQVEGVKQLHNLLLYVESWAKETCRLLQLKFKPLTKSEKASASCHQLHPRQPTTFLELLTSELEPLIGLSFEYEEHRNKIDSMSGSTGYRKADRTAGVKQCFVDTIVTETLTQNKDTDMRDTTAANQNNGDDNSDLGAWSSSDEEDDFDEFGPDEEHESDGDPEMLHCLCQLRESSTKSTMVNCDACHKWSHLT
jgi:hypothetical protein